MLIFINYWVDQVCKVLLFNFNVCLDLEDIFLVVIYNISLLLEEFGGFQVEVFFQNCLDLFEYLYFEEICDLKVFFYFLICCDGELVQFVVCDQCVWYVGVFCWCDCDNCNDFVFGIELEGVDYIFFEDGQYCSLCVLFDVLVVYYLCLFCDIVIGYEYIVLGCKIDSGLVFDWI